MIIFFIFMVLAVLLLIHGYVGVRIIPTLNVASTVKMWIWVAIAILAFLPLLGPVLHANGFENRFADAIAWIGYTSLGFFVLAFIFIGIRDLGWSILGAGTKIVNQKDVISFDPDRRDALVYMMNLGILSITTGLTAYGFFRATRSPDVIRVEVPIKNLPDALDGFRIVQLSDIHVGPTIKREFVEQVVQQTIGLKPDLIALTGDLVDGSVDYLSQDVEPLKKLDAPFGKYFITGNHEYYAGVDAWLAKTYELGFINLINEHRTVNVNGALLNVSGVTDIMAAQMDKRHASDPEKAMRGAPEESIKLMLAHQPGTIHEAQKLGVDLMLAGHTHGGQFKPFDFAVSRAHPYISGLHNHHGTWIYVNRGTGYWGPPLRLGIPNEITLITLTSNPS